MDHVFWRHFREAVKEVKPDCLILGEISHNAAPWLDGDQLDSMMNYTFRDIVIDFFAKGSIKAGEFDERLAKLRMLYRDQVNEVLYNLVGSHDTTRFLALCRGRSEKMRCATIFQMTYVGMPVVYYGDEVGMTSEIEWSDNRRPMIWDKRKQDRALLTFFSKLIAIRKQNRPLTDGDFTTILADSNTNMYAFLRHDETGKIAVLINNSSSERVMNLRNRDFGWSPSTSLKDLLTENVFTSSNSETSLQIQPYSGIILSGMA